jgi:hypothetical protein
MIIRKFISEYSEYIDMTISELNDLKKINSIEFSQELLIRSDEIIKTIQKFIIKSQTALRLMYSKTINYQCFIEEKDEFINLITNLVMQDDKLYEKLYELFELSLNDQVEVLRKKFDEMKTIKPEDLGIPEKFCLNEKTLEFQRKLVGKNDLTDK